MEQENAQNHPNRRGQDNQQADEYGEQEIEDDQDEQIE